jgi:ligand-binding sensor domain-containing protein
VLGSLFWLLLSARLLAATEAACVRNWHIEEGLPDGDITAITQTPDGFLWVGTTKGLARFDGLKFRVFNSANTPGMGDCRISSLLTDHSGTLWVGTLDGNVLRRHGDRFERLPPPALFAPRLEGKQGSSSWLWDRRIHLTEDTRQGRASDAVPDLRTDLVEDEQGTIWWHVSDRGLARLSVGQWTLCSASNRMALAGLRQIGRDHEGHVWAEAGGALYRWQTNQWNPAASANPLDGRWPVLAPANHGGLWLAEPHGSWLESGGQIRRLAGGPTEATARPTLQSLHSSRSTPTCLLEDHAGRLWYGTASGGVFFLDAAGQWQRLKTRGAFSQGYVSCLFEDTSGALWVGTVGDGLYRVTGQPVTMLTVSRSLEDIEINTLCMARDGAVWVGTGGAGAFRWRGPAGGVPYGPAEGLSNTHVCAIYEDRETNVWAGTAGGLFRLEGERFIRPAGPHPLEGWVKAVFEDRSGRLWIGTSSGLVLWKEGKFSVYPPPAGAGNFFDIRAIAEDPTGNLWVGTIGQGLFRLPPDRLGNLQPVANYPAPDVRALYCDAGGTLWIGSWGAGLIRMRGDRFTVFALKDGLPCEKIQSIVPDSAQTLWMSSDNGIVGVRAGALDDYQRGQSPPLTCLRVSLAEGLGNRSCSGSGQPVAARAPDGRLWFPNFEGIAVLDPRRVEEWQSPTHLLVEAVIADGKELAPAPNGEFRVESAVRRFEFAYVAPVLGGSSELRFRHKLEGLDRDWVDAGTERVARYSQLPPGVYQFRVMVNGGDNQWHPAERTITLRVVPRLWERGWVRGLAGGLGVALACGGLVWGQRRKYRARLGRARMQSMLENERHRFAEDRHQDFG